ncbi:adenylate/guanylate cyclase domain-containing protein [Microvirga pudoricolor]|uniref:adenylate/guanylate cyclase domain-containing protein n=1 Tax=Microvirga pudoricolor TaxID=2778729 RepID=UPI001951434E|nr:adenylate/guanylate cyclase domain-containing protein [Microvirga pudoricolor]MBM6595617.1 hypothetical protein [Microvirga pudoricolor]
MNERVKRRLTTVLCADVQGYSRLMGADEPGTLAALRRARAAMAALVERHDGRIVNTWGDAVIAEFASVVEAVQCAVEIQAELKGEEGHPDSGAPESPEPGPSGDGRMRFRIGINLGDVMVDGGDIYGDGVNIAARLQEMAEPGGILVSGPVYDQVHNKLSVGFENLGPRPVKNVALPVISYRVTAGGGASNLSAAAMPVPARAPRAEGMAGLFRDMPPAIAAMLVSVPLLILINLFTGIQRMWFHWPVTSILAVVLFWAITRRTGRRRS